MGEHLEASRRVEPAKAGVHFTVASSAGHRSSERLDLSEDLALVKASLLYADQVKLCSVGSSLLSAIAEYAEASEEKQAKLVVRYLSDLQPSMSADDVRFFEAVVGLRPRRERRAVSNSARRKILAMIHWSSPHSSIQQRVIPRIGPTANMGSHRSPSNYDPTRSSTGASSFHPIRSSRLLKKTYQLRRCLSSSTSHKKDDSSSERSAITRSLPRNVICFDGTDAERMRGDGCALIGNRSPLTVSKTCPKLQRVFDCNKRDFLT